MLDAVIDGRLERASAEEWAQRRIDALDQGRLVFVPAEEERRLLMAIDVLLRVSERDEAGDYVHSIEALNRLRGGL